VVRSRQGSDDFLLVNNLIRRIRLRRIARVVARQLHGFLLAVLAVPHVSDDHGHHIVGVCPDRGEVDIAVDALQLASAAISGLLCDGYQR